MRYVITIFVLVIVFALCACGQTDSGGSADTPEASPVPELTAPEAESATAEDEPDDAGLGDTLTVGNLEVTPEKIRDKGIGEGDGYSFEAQNGKWVAIWMRWKNVGADTIAEYPTAQVANEDGTIYEIGMLNDPEPNLIFNMVDFKLPAGAAREGWLTFDISGSPAKLFIYMSDPSDPMGAAEGVWDLTK